MTQTFSTALVGGVMAAVSTWAFLQFPGLLIWAAFIGWASFIHSGGAAEVLAKVICALTMGVVIAWVVGVLVLLNPLGLPIPLIAGMLVGLATVCIVLMSTTKLLSIAPAVFYGFAASFAFLTLKPDTFSLTAMTSFSLENVVPVVGLSLISGALFGLGHTSLAAMLTSEK
jgi:hypothetical protein